ncbi:hypothetical protein GGS23DRAFT_569039 [Durotheca rogersii]|uniref:uncharacterized protein n=1 Tax=Durotheca rogersii TaxID=419775 RepID=UPI00221E9930|nr:uncharacterized protein GGS23DRAFT_569039 [Durotheca rogersii]KAI5863273.1 hypothetical protein GGS23DRAFT_569039 [Durotheca rogersii]
MGNDAQMECTHVPSEPLELARQLPERILEAWTAELWLAWDVFIRVLELAQRERRQAQSHADRTHQHRCEHNEYHNIYSGSNDLGVLRAAVQTELVTL